MDWSPCSINCTNLEKTLLVGFKRLPYLTNRNTNFLNDYGLNLF